MKGITVAFLLLAALALAAPAAAQTPVPPKTSFYSLQRLSAGLTIEYVAYKPELALAGIQNTGEVKVALPIAYNVGRYSSLQGKVRYGVTSKVYEYSAGVTLHVLARGGRP